MARAAAIAATGAALGAVGRLSDTWPHAPRLLFVLGAPWVVTAVAVGALTPGTRRAAAAGAAALVFSVAVYYALMSLAEGRVGVAYALAMTAGWGALAALIGAVFGAAGELIRRGAPRARSVAAALAGGALAGEAILFLPRAQTANARLMVAAQLLVGVAGALALTHRGGRGRALALTGSVAGLALVVDVAARVVMRRYGWGG